MLSPEEHQKEIDRESTKMRDFMGENPDWYEEQFGNSFDPEKELNFDD